MISRLHPTPLWVWPVTCDEVILTCQDLEDGSKEEASALDQFEQLKHERNEGEEAE